jgi:hypothetical protein
MQEPYKGKLEAIPDVHEWTLIKLRDAKLSTVAKVLKALATYQGREKINQETGLPLEELLDIANKADMLRIRRMGPKNIIALRYLDVRTVRDLACRNPMNLRIQLLTKTNHLLKFLPSIYQVRSWVEQAKELEKVITYNPYKPRENTIGKDKED